MRNQASYMLDFSLTNLARLDRPSYLMEYRGVQFKLVQERGWKWADHLLVHIPSYSEQAHQHAFQIAQELVSLLSWELRMPMHLSEAGGRSCRKDSKLSKMRPFIRTFPQIPFRGNFVNNSPSIIPAIDNEQQRLALGLFREARASNNDYLSFFFFWHVIETGRESGSVVVDRIVANGRLGLAKEDVARLSLAGRSLGDHLREDVRNAVAHIRRNSGRRSLELTSLQQRQEMACAARVTRRVAEVFIENELAVGARKLYLARKGRNGFPVYMDLHHEPDAWRFRDAYPRKPFRI